MPRIDAGGTGIFYEIFNPEGGGVPALLIRGLGTQMIMWPKPFIERLTERGWRVIVWDNRDTGLSEKFADRPSPAYVLSDMAADGANLLAALGESRAHVLGMSMGGMIAQLMAVEHPEKVASLVSVMSTTGNPDLPRATPEAWAALTSAPPPPADRAAVIAHTVRTSQVVGSPGYPAPVSALEARAAAAYDRCYCPGGVARQMAAVMADGDRRERLARITAPALVIHGADDPLIPAAGGEDTARHIPEARLEMVPGMGHNIPPGLEAELADMAADHWERAARAALDRTGAAGA